MYEVAGKKNETLIDSTKTLLLSASTFEFSADKKFILTATGRMKIFRHSYVAKWDVYDIERKALIPITIAGVQEPALISLVKFSPVDNSMIVLYNNNIYYKKSPTDPEVQITSDGSKDIYNGVPDWVNEEEVFSTNSATWFSPDGKKIAFIRFNDTDVPVMALPIYGEVGSVEYQYPKIFAVNYPKVAANNPEVKLLYVDLSTITNAASVVTSEIPVPSRFQNIHVDHLITSVSWATNDELVAVFMNRVQNQGDILKCSAASTTPTCTPVHSLDVTGGWIEFFTAPFYNKAGDHMVFIGSENGYRHIQSLNLNTNATTARTSGNFVVTEILQFNKEQNVIIFTANTPDDIKAQHVYAVKDEDGAQKHCLTCSLIDGYTYYSAEASTGGSNLVVTAAGPAVPQFFLFSLLFTANGINLTAHVELESNGKLRAELDKLKLPTIRYETVTLDNGSESQVMLALPSDLDMDKKYPMIVDVYGGK